MRIIAENYFSLISLSIPGKETYHNTMINRQLCLLPALLTILLIICALLPDHLSSALRFERIAIAEGELWRLITAHLVHLSWQHLLMNIAGLWLIYWLAGSTLIRYQWIVALILCAIGTSLGLYFFTNIDWYVGLSGVLHGLLCLAAIRLIQQKQYEGVMLLAIVIGKVGGEQWQGANPALEQVIGGNVMVDAHLYGAISGLLIAPVVLSIKFMLEANRPDVN